VQYEYKILSIGNDEFGNKCERLTFKLNELGKTGWEFVSIISQQGLGTSSYNLLGITQRQWLVLKRSLEQGR
jgi:hypothetical protein